MTSKSALLVTVWICSAALLGCARDATSDREYTDISYARFKSVVDTEGLDPQGASNISYRCFRTKDGQDSWLSMTIPAADYRSLQQRFAKDMEDPELASPGAVPLGPVRKAFGKDPSVPRHWPEPSAPPPAWWTPPASGTSLVCTLWELQVDNSPPSGRAKGWYWLYDRNASVLWIWEWDHPHHDLGWARPHGPR